MKIKKTLGIALAGALSLVAFALPAGAQASANDPIVFVHGFTGTPASWNYFTSRFIADGYTSDDFASVSYGPYDSNVATANKVQAAVEGLKASTGKSKVDIITHSMGGLGSRYYLKYLGGTSSVDEWVSIGGPNHGTTWAPVCVPIYPIPCAQMIPASPFQVKLNLGDETPGSVRYLTQASTCDVIVVPSVATTPLVGATNKIVGCLEHSAMNKTAVSYDGVRAFLN
ncbi:MAG: lipase [Thermoleophilaceae bacterium]|nr:lipase [Thermoleophilaceae bacterium]